MLIALSLATVLAFAVTYVMYWKLRSGSAHPNVTQVVAAAHDLPAGVVLTAVDLKTVDWPVGVPLPGSYSKIEQVVDRALIYPVGAKEPILERDVAVEGSGLGLSVRIPPGMRATSVRSNEIVGVAGFLYPGSHVDVLATVAVPGNPTAETQTILQNVEVLTAGEKIEPDPQGKPQTVNVVTLLLNSEDSQKLLLASTQGTIQFVLRNNSDQAKTPVSATSLNQLLAGSRQTQPESAPQAPKKGNRPPSGGGDAAPEAFQLEIIRGNTRSVEKF